MNKNKLVKREVNLSFLKSEVNSEDMWSSEHEIFKSKNGTDQFLLHSKINLIWVCRGSK